jgi:hypothetical protein
VVLIDAEGRLEQQLASRRQRAEKKVVVSGSGQHLHAGAPGPDHEQQTALIPFAQHVSVAPQILASVGPLQHIEVGDTQLTTRPSPDLQQTFGGD